MQLFFILLFGVRTLQVSKALCVHHQEHYKL